MERKIEEGRHQGKLTQKRSSNPRGDKPQQKAHRCWKWFLKNGDSERTTSCKEWRLKLGFLFEETRVKTKAFCIAASNCNAMCPCLRASKDQGSPPLKRRPQLLCKNHAPIHAVSCPACSSACPSCEHAPVHFWSTYHEPTHVHAGMNESREQM